MGVAFIVFFPFAVRRLEYLQDGKWMHFLIIGYLSSGIPSILFPIAQQYLSSSVAGILNSLTPLFTLLIALLFYRASIGYRQALGVFIGFLGAGLLIWMNNNGSQNKNLYFAILIVLATLCYGTNVNFLQNKMRGVDSLTISALSYMFTGIPAILYLVRPAFLSKLNTSTPCLIALSSVVFLSVLGTCISSILFNNLVKATSGIWASTVTYLMPIFSILIGWLDGESVEWFHILGMCIILAGVYLSSRKD